MFIIFIMLYITSLVVIYLINGGLHLLTTCIQFPPYPYPLPRIWCLFLWVCLFCHNNGVTTLCSFLVHSIVIRYFYTFQKDHHESSYHLSLCKDITKELIIFLQLYISYPWLIYFASGSLYLLISLIYFFHPLQPPSGPPPIWQRPVCSLYL